MNEHEAMREAFLEGALRVQGIVSGSDRPPSADASGQRNQFLIAVLDTSNHPLVHITDLARLHEQEDLQSLTRVLWTYVIDDPGGNLVKLTCTYQEPVALSFSVIFECNAHWEFLRQVVETGVIDIADNPPQSEQEMEEHWHLRIVVSGEPIDDLTMFLRVTRIVGLQKQKGDQVTDIEIMLAALDAKRFMSMDEVKMIASSVLQMPAEGRQSLHVRTLRANEKMAITDISPHLKNLLLRLVDNKTVTLGLIRSVVHVIRMDWLMSGPAF
jgi:hypothetical protein